MAELVKNRILIVDDEKSNLVLLSRILSEKYTIYTAKDGESAVRKASEFLPDLILLDIHMPGMSGYDVLNALKRQAHTRAIPIIFVTGIATAAEEEKALTYNAVDFILKPYNPNIVKLRVRSQIRIVNQIRTIERLSMTDQLTEIPNRRNLDSRLNMEWRRAIRETLSISILMLDIDRFKAYNDLYGHQQGDMVLKSVARCITQCLKRPSDFAARWGGEEFAVLLTNTDSQGAMVVAERIRSGVESLGIPGPKIDGVAKPVTISIGAAATMPDNTSSLDKLISAADTALYNAKDAGRNRVIMSGA